MTQADSFTGAASLSIPILTSECRGSEPQLNLSYSSASGNGVFGRGFHLPVPSISRQITKGIPRYDQTDTFVFSGADTLVPALDQNGQQQSFAREGFTVTVFRPLIENSFRSIERWEGNGKNFWRAIDGENTVSFYGHSRAAQIADPADQGRVFEWLLEAVVDRHGNARRYIYKAENFDGVDAGATHEDNRSVAANKYLRSICYGPPTPIAQSLPLQPDALEALDGQWHFEVVFDYGEYQVAPTNSNPYQPSAAHWLARQDAFSTYKAGFEIRTFRLCRHILMFHRFAELNGGEPVLVHALRCHYAESPKVTLLKAVEHLGYQHRPDQAYSVECLPPLELGYTAFAPEEQSFDLLQDEQSAPLTGSASYTLIDLYGEGIPGLLYSDGRTTYYREPALVEAREETATASPPMRYPPLRYGPNLYPKTLPLRQLAPDAEHILVDLTGNGQPDWVVAAPGQSGWYEANSDRSWQPFRPFERFPTDFHAPDSRLVDVTGDGLSDCLLMQQQVVRFYPNLREQGFGAAQETERQEHLPASLRSSADALVTFADLAGSGQEHLVRITASAVEYWPNMGYGRFGKPIRMSDAPQLDSATFRPDRVLLADIDGSGTTDLIYVLADRVAVYLNQSGNSFSAPIEILLPEPLDQLDQISLADVYGNGGSCLLYSKTHPSLRRLCYDFTGGQKPYLLNRVVNNQGGETTLRYRSSAHFYLEDKQNQQPWITNLPFPIQVVERIEHKDLAANSTLSSHFHYHHGYYDGVEREFRGFGMIERRDAERPAQANSLTWPFTAPALVKTWYHTGAEQANTLARQYEMDYYKEDAAAVLLPDASIDFGPAQGDAETLRMAQRALMGSVLREEVYAEDNTPQQLHPYTVVETRYHLRLLQPKSGERYAVFLRALQETLTYDYERSQNDPRISHEATLELDEFGRARRSCHISYGRRPAAGNEPEQSQIRATFLINDYIHKREEDLLLIGFPKESQLFEIKNLQAPPGSGVFSFEELAEMFADPSKSFPASVSAERLHWERHFYTAPGQTPEMAFGEISREALLCRTEAAAFTGQQISEAPETLQRLMKNPGGYQDHDGYWWNPGVSVSYDALEQFCLPRAVKDTFGNETSYQYDDHHLIVIVTRDALGNQARAEDVDYRLLQPRRVIDINDNRMETVFDPLGRPFVTSHYGTEGGEQAGFKPLSQYQPVAAFDSEKIIAQPEAFLQEAAVYTFEDNFSWMGRAQPESFAALQLGSEQQQSLQDELIARGYMNRQGALFQAFHDLTSAADLNLSEPFQSRRETLFDVLRRIPRQQPTYTLQLTAETYPNASQRPIQISLTYLDGFGRVLQQKQKVESGEALLVAAGNLSADSNQLPSGITDNRWWTSGRVVYDNKGNAVQEFEPFFADTHAFIDQPALRQFGAVRTFYYDPLGRAAQVLTAKGFLIKREWTAWEETLSDENDTIKDAPYYKANDPNHPDSASPFFDTDRRPEVWEAAEKAEIFYRTPQRHTLDNLGQVIIEEDTNTSRLDPAKRILKTRHSRDIQGLLQSSADPRLGSKGINNLRTSHGLMGEALNAISVDAGSSWSLSDCMGAMIYHEDERGFNLRVSHDALHRPVELKVTGGDGPPLLDYVVERIVYGDSADNLIDTAARAAANLNGKVVRHFDQSGVTEFGSYSMLGQPLSTSQRLAVSFDQAISWPSDAVAGQGLLQSGAPFNSVYEYDSQGRVVRAADAIGNILFYSYDLTGAVSSVKVKTPGDTEPQPYLKTVTHNARGQRVSAEYGDGQAVTRYSFDAKTFEMIRAQTASAGNADILDLQYAHDPAGNIKSVKKRVGLAPQANGQPLELVSEYEYDALYQLIQATGSDLDQSGSATGNGNLSPDLQLSAYTQRFKYDDGRNLYMIEHRAASKTDVTELVVSETSNRAVGKELAADARDVDALFDRGGNQLRLRPQAIVRWNYHDNIQQITLNQGENRQVIESYVYDSAGRRVRKVTERRSVSGGTEFEECIYLGNCEIRRVVKGDDLTTGQALEEIHSTSIGYGADLIATHQRWVKGDPPAGVARSQTRFALSDQIGSSLLEFDEAGNLLTFEEFYPYGDPAIIAAGNADQIRLKRYRYSGKERESNTGIYYYGFRYYQPQAGRWLSADPAGPVDGLNSYGFVKGNPATFLDAAGLLKIVHWNTYKAGAKRFRSKQFIRHLDYILSNQHQSESIVFLTEIMPSVRNAQVNQLMQRLQAMRHRGWTAQLIEAGTSRGGGLREKVLILHRGFDNPINYHQFLRRPFKRAGINERSEVAERHPVGLTVQSRSLGELTVAGFHNVNPGEAQNPSAFWRQNLHELGAHVIIGDFNAQAPRVRSLYSSKPTHAMTRRGQRAAEETEHQRAPTTRGQNNFDYARSTGYANPGERPIHVTNVRGSTLPDSDHDVITAVLQRSKKPRGG